MLSFRARLIRFILMHRELIFKLKFKKEVIDWNTYEAVLRFREEVEAGAGKFGRLPEGMETSPFKIDALPAEWLIPAGADKDKAILYFHGGGYVSGTINAHRAITSKFAKGTGISTLLFEYRLAPEHTYPAAVDDSLAAYKWLLKQGFSPEKIGFIGDSSGGGLALAALLAIRDKGLPLPAACAAYSPVTDYTCSGETYTTNLKKCLAPEGTGQAFSKHYSGKTDPAAPYISPLFGDLHGLPPLIIFAGGNETLLSDSTRFAEKAKAAGVDVTLHIGEGLFHCYPACAPMFPEATKALNQICEFVKVRTAGPLTPH